MLPGISLFGSLLFSAYSLCSPHFLLLRWAFSRRPGKMAVSSSGSSLSSQVCSASVHCNSKERFCCALLLVIHLPLAQGLSAGTGLHWPCGCVHCLTDRPELHGVGRWDDGGRGQNRNMIAVQHTGLRNTVD